MWKVQVVHATWTEQVHGPNGRRAPQVTPRPANLQCQNTLVTLTSWENRGRCRLTPKFPIKHENKTICLTWGSRLTPKGAAAFSPLQPLRCVSGWRTDPWGEWVGGGTHEMKYVQAGCDCPTSVNLICTSSLLPGYATMKSISMIPWHQSLRLPSGWPACSCTNTLKKKDIYHQKAICWQVIRVQHSSLWCHYLNLLVIHSVLFD